MSQLINIPALSLFLSIIDTLNESSGLNYMINLLRIVIIGIQSSGKSSVIQNISDMELPRNEGVATKAPLQLRLRKSTDREYCRIKYGDEPEDKWIEIQFFEVNEYIRKYQNRLFNGDNNAILSEKLICLEAHKKHLSDLTIIDLPGITHYNPETEQLVKELVIDYIKQPNTLVLFAHNATMDFVADECLKIITEISENTPEDEINILDRTIPLLTKIDLATTEQLIKNVEDCKRYKFKYSPIMIRNSNKGNELNDGGNSNQRRENYNENNIYGNHSNMYNINNENNSNNNNENSNDNNNTIDHNRKNISEEYQNNRRVLINKERQIEESLIRKYFKNSTLKSLCSSYQGIRGLTRLLVEIETDFLHNKKSDVKNEINKCLEYSKEEKATFPKAIDNKYDFIEKFCYIKNEFNRLLKISFENSKNVLPNENGKFDEKEFEYCVETNIRFKFEEFRKNFNEKFYNYLTLEYYKKMHYIWNDDIKIAFQNYYGERVIYKTLFSCIEPYFEKFPELMEQIQSIISKEVDKVFNSIFNEYVNVFDKFVTISQQKLTEMKNKYLENCKKSLKEIKEKETKTLYIVNNYYIEITKMMCQKIKQEINRLEHTNINGNSDSNNNEDNSDDGTQRINDSEETCSNENYQEDDYNINNFFKDQSENSDNETIENPNNENSSENVEENINKNNSSYKNNGSINNNSNLYDDNENYKIDFNKNDKDYDTKFFFTFTGLNQNYFNTFVRDLYSFKKVHKKIKWNLIEAMCSEYAYLKLFMDRILDSVFKEIYINLLLPFKEGSFIQELDKLFICMSETELLQLMEINEETVSKLQEIENVIQKLEEASKNLDSINKKIIHKPSRNYLKSN
ncbi:hypothetical protein BCR32DRAFT_302229 [Anaeromyces robustus]|uniref:Dynamin-type G domain-containing protein n=1 Tax=Anaeromyces robustus TaxID=1754192 RepID=A0A1Y1XKI8_9FUNG|nr:hypothetical protein BCR32DRAFT_302229 [Anaeromyces robustus]|eukprot:ORX86279.1 hypothetical protein BCR32DRAFT_302229 [Anaeromyces robustus]